MPYFSLFGLADITLKSLPETIAPCLMHAYPDLEIIIVDDGSADGIAARVASRNGGFLPGRRSVWATAGLHPMSQAPRKGVGTRAATALALRGSKRVIGLALRGCAT